MSFVNVFILVFHFKRTSTVDDFRPEAFQDKKNCYYSLTSSPAKVSTTLQIEHNAIASSGSFHRKLLNFPVTRSVANKFSFLISKAPRDSYLCSP